MMRNNAQKEQADSGTLSQTEARLWELHADICQTLANPKRLQIINLLKDGELSVGAMVRALGVAKANLSQHLAVMRQKGILATRREGTTVYYRLAVPRIMEACKIMRQVLQDALNARGELSRRLRSAEAGVGEGREGGEDD